MKRFKQGAKTAARSKSSNLGGCESKESAPTYEVRGCNGRAREHVGPNPRLLKRGRRKVKHAVDPRKLLEDEQNGSNPHNCEWKQKVSTIRLLVKEDRSWREGEEVRRKHEETEEEGRA